MSINLDDAGVFDLVADYFEPYRVSYPSELMDFLLKTTQPTSTSHLLEIGSGTGKATELLAPRGFNILCVEPGANLLNIAQNKFRETDNVQFALSKFEEFESEPDHFDLIYSAQAFHWLPQPDGFKKCALLLKQNGHLALFWNLYITTNSSWDQGLREISHKWDDLILLYTFDEAEERIKSDCESIVGSDIFSTPESYSIKWQKSVPLEEMIGFIHTTIVFNRKGEAERKMILDDIRELFREYGGVIQRTYYSYILVAAKINFS